MNAQAEAIAETVIAEKEIAGNWTLDQIFAIFGALTAYDLKIERKISKLKKRAIILFVLALLGFVGGMWSSASPSVNPGFVIPLFVVAAIGFVGGMLTSILIWLNTRKDVPNEYRTYLQPILNELREDIKPESDVEISLDLAPLQSKQYSQGKSQKYSKGAYHSCYDYTYEREWLNLRARLNDGNRLQVGVTEILVKTRKTKRNPRGKYKTRYKYRKRYNVDARVLLDSETFHCTQLPPDDGTKKFYAKNNDGKVVVGVKFSEKKKGNPSKMTLEPLSTLHNVMALYSHIHPKKQAAAA